MNVGLYGINYPIIAYYDAQVAMGQSSWLCGEGNIATNQQVWIYGHFTIGNPYDKMMQMIRFPRDFMHIVICEHRAMSVNNVSFPKRKSACKLSPNILKSEAPFPCYPLFSYLV